MKISGENAAAAVNGGDLFIAARREVEVEKSDRMNLKKEWRKRYEEKPH